MTIQAPGLAAVVPRWTRRSVELAFSGMSQHLSRGSFIVSLEADMLEGGTRRLCIATAAEIHHRAD